MNSECDMAPNPVLHPQCPEHLGSLHLLSQETYFKAPCRGLRFSPGLHLLATEFRVVGGRSLGVARRALQFQCLQMGETGQSPPPSSTTTAISAAMIPSPTSTAGTGMILRSPTL